MNLGKKKRDPYMNSCFKCLVFETACYHPYPELVQNKYKKIPKYNHLEPPS